MSSKIIESKYGNIKIQNHGYYQVASYKEGNHNKLLHRLIWEDHYQTKIPENYVIHHINENKLDNRIQNLQCVENLVHNKYNSKKTRLEKVRKKMSKAQRGRKHSKETKMKISIGNRGEKQGRAKLSEKNVIEIKKLLREGNLFDREIAKIYGVSRKAINNIKLGQTWCHVDLVP